MIDSMIKYKIISLVTKLSRRCPRCRFKLGHFSDGTIGLATYYYYPHGTKQPPVTESYYQCGRCNYKLSKSLISNDDFLRMLRSKKM